MEFIKLNKSYSQLTEKDKKYIIDTYYKYKHLKASEIRDNLNISHRAMLSVMKEYGINSKLKNRYTLNEDYFNIIDTERKAYILGFIYADGYVGATNYNNIVIQSNDKEIIEEIAKEINFTGNVRETNKGGFENSKNGWVLNFSNIKIAEDLRRLGATPNKSLILNSIPPIRENLKRHFLRGYFDGDGSILISDNTRKYKDKIYHYEQLNFNLIATQLMIENIVKVFEITQYSIANSKTPELKYLRIKAINEMNKLYNLMYRYATIFLSRKKEIWDKFFECH